MEQQLIYLAREYSIFRREKAGLTSWLEYTGKECLHAEKQLLHLMLIPLCLFAIQLEVYLPVVVC
jgi:hypothetical protein